MNAKQADKKLEQIRKLAEELEGDKELLNIDPRYSITAGWIDTDIDNCDPS